MSRVSVGEMGGAVLWTASAIAVTSYTWDAYKSAYKKFPGMGGGLSGPNVAAAVGKASGIASGNAITEPGPTKTDKAGSSKVSAPGNAGIGGGIINWFTQNVLGLQGPDNTVPTKNRPGRARVQPLIHAINANQPQQALTALEQLQKRQKSLGWSTADFQSWFDAQPWSGKFSRVVTGRSGPLLLTRQG